MTATAQPTAERWTAVTPLQFDHWIGRYTPALDRQIDPGGPNLVCYYDRGEIVASYDLDSGTGHAVRADRMSVLGVA